jgi:hypothetical protein
MHDHRANLISVLTIPSLQLFLSFHFENTTMLSSMTKQEVSFRLAQLVEERPSGILKVRTLEDSIATTFSKSSESLWKNVCFDTVTTYEHINIRDVSEALGVVPSLRLTLEWEAVSVQVLTFDQAERAKRRHRRRRSKAQPLPRYERFLKLLKAGYGIDELVGGSEVSETTSDRVSMAKILYRKLKAAAQKIVAQPTTSLDSSPPKYPIANRAA